MKKICYLCKQEKDLLDFAKYKKGGKIYYTYCKECYRKKDKERNKKRQKYLKEYRANNTEKTKVYNKEYFEKNKNILKEKRKQYYEDNKENILRKRKEYVEKNKKIINLKRKYKRKTDELFKFTCDIRSRLNYCFNIKYKIKRSKYEEIIGTSIKKYRESLIMTFEKRYKEKWSWDKIKEVEIDHIIPISFASNLDEAKKLCHYTNLQLLKTKDNKEKVNKIKEEDRV